MWFRAFKSIVLGLTLLVASLAAAPERENTAKALMPNLVDDPELPAADGSSDTPEIEVTMIDGKKFKLSSLRGKVCLIDMFASWCPHCQEHAPQMAEIYKQFSPKGFAILSLATDRPDKLTEIKAFIKNYKVNYPVGYLTNEVMAYYMDSHNHSIPQVVLFGKNGKMMKRWIGWGEERTKELISLLEGELGVPASGDAAAEASAPATKAPAAKTAATKATPRRKN